MEPELRAYTQNRELSWLAFNERVLEEATDPSVPLGERLKFLAIFTSNLDEFFMIRVGSLTDIAAMDPQAADSRTGMTTTEQLERIYDRVRVLYEKRDNVYEELSRQLCGYGICAVPPEELKRRERKELKTWFREQVLPILSPQIVDRSHPFPHLANKQLYVIANLTGKQQTRLGIVPVPAMLPDIVILPGDTVRFIPMEQLLLTFLDQVFDQYKITDRNIICVTRNGDISPDDEGFDVEEDLRAHMRKLLHKRRKLAAVRLETAYPLEERLAETLLHHCRLETAQVFQTQAPMKMDYVSDLLRQLPEDVRRLLSYPHFSPHNTLSAGPEGILKLVRRQDLLLSFPYESMDPFLRLLKEAAVDPDVMSIRITIYRLARNARLVEYLCAAAENGKDVTVLIELRARFDEQNNIDWSQRLEEAGCRVLYGFETYKVHSKVCLITLRGPHGPRYITQIGTGNYNEKTAELYTDLSLITADPQIGRDAGEFFKNMAIGNLNGHYDHLLVAPVSFKQTLLAMIRGEQEKGPRGRIVIKCNSVTDRELICALSDASRAGVPIDLIVRGICCILPGVPGCTETVHVTSIVGRYLEHARIYAFGAGEDRKLFIGSGDMMTRNTQRRVEVVTPVYDPALKEELERYLDVQLRDTVKARELCSDGTYRKKTGAPVNAQETFMAAAAEKAARAGREGQRNRRETEGFVPRILRRMGWTG